ncbi:glyoxylase-like metal-dependent hydrolase (beta-lactamase superfamily II) [Bradyrhizobium sp. LM6.10]
MGNAYEIYALRYATMSPRTPNMNFLAPDPHDSAAQDLDYFVWLIRGGGRDILVDTGFNAEEATARARKLTLNPVDALERFGVATSSIRDIIVTHLHYDHAGNLDRFPNARFHLQEREMAYATGRCMCNGLLRHPFSVEHVTQMVRHVYGERVNFYSGDGEVAPRRHRAPRRRPFGRLAGGEGRDRARAGGAGVRCRALLRQPPAPEPFSDRLQHRRHGAGLGDDRAARRPS